MYGVIVKYFYAKQLVFKFLYFYIFINNPSLLEQFVFFSLNADSLLKGVLNSKVI